MRPARPAFSFALLILLSIASAPVHAATLTVNDTGEGADANPGDGVCATAGAVCTLRAAIQEANALAGADTIVVPEIPSGSVTHYVQTSLLPNVTTAITVAGADQAKVRIESGGGHSGLFYVVGGTLTLQHATVTGVASGNVITSVNGGTVMLDDVLSDSNSVSSVSVTGSVPPYPMLTVTNSTFSNDSSGFGGAIYLSNANLTVSGTAFTDNQASQYGGAIYIGGTGAVSITGCTFDGNTSGLIGGAIVSYSTAMTIASSTFTNNSAAAAAGALQQYGAAAMGATVAVTITDSTFQNNVSGDVSHSQASGGAIVTGGPIAVRRSTFVGNSALGSGGAVLVSTGGGLIATDSTFSGNDGPLGGGAIDVGSNTTASFHSVTITDNTTMSAFGGGVYVSPGVTAAIANSIVAGNHATVSPDCVGTLTSQGYNLIGDGSGCSLGSATGDQIGTGASPIDPHLAGIANNGGPTMTHALQSNSTAGDRGNPAGCNDDDGTPLTVDQRGQARVVDGDGNGAARCDIGAYEAPGGTFPTPTTSTTTTTTTTTVVVTTTLPGTTTTTTVAASTTTSTPVSTTTTLPSDDPVCVNGVTISHAKLVLTHIAPPTGDVAIVLRGTLDFAAGVPTTFDPATRGLQLWIEDLGAGGDVLALTHRTTPVPGGPGCTAKDGWKKLRYRNTSGELPPVCASKSADGLSIVQFADRRAKHKGIPFVFKTKGSSFATPVGPFRVTVVLGASADASLAGECGVHEFVLSSCKVTAKRVLCR